MVRNRLNRFHLAADVIDRSPAQSGSAVYVKQAMRDKLVEHEPYIVRHGKEMPEITRRR